MLYSGLHSGDQAALWGRTVDRWALQALPHTGSETYWAAETFWDLVFLSERMDTSTDITNLQE